MRIAALFSMMLGLVLLSGCASLNLDADVVEAPQYEIAGPGDYVAAYTGIPEFNGTVAQLNLLGSGEHSGRLAGLEIWPLGGVELGLLGARVNLLGLELGAGTLFYQGLAERPWLDHPEH